MVISQIVCPSLLLVARCVKRFIKAFLFSLELLTDHSENCSLMAISKIACPSSLLVAIDIKKVQRKFLIFHETSSISYHYTLDACVEVIGSERWQERLGGLKRVSCFDIFSLVSTRFMIYFPGSS